MRDRIVGTLSWSVVAGVLVASVPSFAQPAGPPASPSARHPHASEDAGVALFPTREASGTAWLPSETLVSGVHRTWGAWEIMLHGTAFGQLLYEPGDRHRTGGFSSRQGSSVNWGMAMARRRAGPGRVGLRAMGSLEPWTVPGCGYLSLLATGETCEGDTIHDRQHPHDLFMELAADYDRPLGTSLGWQVYGGLAGEPALGPAGYPHRESATPNPLAPIAHHWLDSTHVVFGLITTGLHGRRWKTELSVFNGREPDENRSNLDLGPLDSVSVRVSLLPTRRLSIQVSAARLREAEAAFPPQERTDLTRATASATYHRLVGERGLWATMLAYGLNSEQEVVTGGLLDQATHAVLLETSLATGGRHTWFGRAEVVGMPAHDLHAHEYAARVFTVGKLQAGYARHFGAWKGMTPGIGAVVSASLVPFQLAPRYDGRVAPGFGLFLTVRPSPHAL